MAKNGGGWAKPYHSLIATLLVLSGSALAGFGIYLRVSKYRKDAFLDFATAANGSTDVLQKILQVDIAAMIVGAFLLVSGLVALFALARNCCGSMFRVFFFVLAVVILLSLAVIAGFAFFLLRYQGKASFRTKVQTVWGQQVRSKPNVICAIESNLQCRGFDNNDCKNCALGVESTCTAAQKLLCAPCSNKTDNVAIGCFDDFRHTISRWFIIIGSVAGGLALLTFIDLFALCQF
jgi:hypothetical protein